MKLFFTQMDPPPAAVRISLEAKGYDCQHLAFRRVQWLEPAERPQLRHDSVLVMTSKNAARWFLSQKFPKPWPPLALVGESTAALLKNEGAALMFKPAAHARELAQTLLQELSTTQKILFLRGKRVSPDLPKTLAGFQLDQLAVYETVKIVPKMALRPTAGMVYFQAPSTVEDFVDAYGFRPEYIAVIGPATRNRVLRQKWSIDFQPSRPELNVFTQELPQPNHFKG